MKRASIALTALAALAFATAFTAPAKAGVGFDFDLDLGFFGGIGIDVDILQPHRRSNPPVPPDFRSPAPRYYKPKAPKEAPTNNWDRPRTYR